MRILALKPGSHLNAVGVYAWYHISALQKASRLANEQLSPEERRALARAMLFDEAFALHFLEDVYAAGHVAGSWGDVSQRKGTHDFYNQNGIEVFTWKGRDKTIVLMGDAHMRPAGRRARRRGRAHEHRAGARCCAGRSRGDGIPYVRSAPSQADASTSARASPFPTVALASARDRGLRGTSLAEVLLDTPVPALGPGLGALPRSRSEVGPFIGARRLHQRTRGQRRLRGLAEPDRLHLPGSTWGFASDWDWRARWGCGRWLAFVQIGLTADGPSTNKFSDTGLGTLGGSLSAAIPARYGLVDAHPDALSTSIPGDLLLLSPMYFFDREKYTQLAVTASNGGLFGWQQGWATRFGRFQFVLGRELGVTFYGLWGRHGSVGRCRPIVPWPRTRSQLQIDYFELPILEYRPYRAFSANQSSDVLFQLFAGADVPYGDSVEGSDRRPVTQSADTFAPVGAAHDSLTGGTTGNDALARNLRSPRADSGCRHRTWLRPWPAAHAGVLAGCAAPLIPYSADTPPLVVVPAAQAGVQDKRARFREIFCAVLEARKAELPDYRPCDEALTRVGVEPAGTARPVTSRAIAPTARRRAGAGIRIRLL